MPSNVFKKYQILFQTALLLYVVMLSAAVRAQVNFGGPIPMRDPDPFHLLFLQFQPQTPDVLPTNKERYRLQFDLINNLLIPNPIGSVTIDDEYQRLMFVWSRGIGGQTELEVNGSLLWRNGGVMDGLITFWHHLFGFPADAIDDPLGRDHWPKYRSILQVVNPQGQTTINYGNGFGLGDTSITLKHPLIKATPRSALAARLAVKIPTGNAKLFLGSGNVDFGADLDARYSEGRDISLYCNIGEVIMGHAYDIPGAQPHMQQGLLAIEYHPNGRDRYILQVDSNSLAVRTGNSFADSAAVTATFGITHIMNKHLALYASYSENGDIHNYTLPGFSNIGPDISFSFGAEYHP